MPNATIMRPDAPKFNATVERLFDRLREASFSEGYLYGENKPPSPTRLREASNRVVRCERALRAYLATHGGLTPLTPPAEEEPRDA